MRKGRFFFAAMSMIVCLFLLIPGCSEKGKEITTSPTESEEITTNTRLALKLTPGQSETYKLITTSLRKASLGSSRSNRAINFQGGQTTEKIEMVFDQQILETQANGNAIAKVTIRQLKYSSEVRDSEVLSFDSSKEDESSNALVALIGQDYTIEITPSGQVVKIIDANSARDAIYNSPSNIEVAKSLLSDSSIIKRHSIPAMPEDNENELVIGQTWSNIIRFDFGLMGSQSYERIYKLGQIQNKDNHQIAIVDMEAIPSIQGTIAGQENPVSNMSDNRQTYTGQMKLDLTNGTLEKYQEHLQTEWIFVLPVSSANGPPDPLNMTAVKSYDIEKVN